MPNDLQILDEPDSDELLLHDGLDNEDPGTGDGEVKPWDPSKIRITTKNFSLRDVVDQIGEHEIDLSPDFQRDYVWKERQRTRLIESILLGIPLPAFYFNQAIDGTYQVVDGVQRLSTIALFMSDSHVLNAADLEYLRNLGGRTFTKLDPPEFRRFRSTQIVVHVIEAQTPDDVKYDIFNRVNTSGSPLSPQEIRHAMSKPKSRAFLKELSEAVAFDNATGHHYWRRDAKDPTRQIRDSGRMTNRELALRFCAFRHYSEDEYRRHSSLDAFLVECTRRIDSNQQAQGTPIQDQALDHLRNDFVRAMENAYQILGKAAFRRWPPGQSRRGPINRAVFESQAIALCEYSIDRLIPKKDEITTAFRAAFDDDSYARAVTVGTGDVKAVETRLSKTKAILNSILS
jgi:hypothetical protein